jgi:hypothetical protein
MPLWLQQLTRTNGWGVEPGLVGELSPPPGLVAIPLLLLYSLGGSDGRKNPMGETLKAVFINLEDYFDLLFLLFLPRGGNI